MEIQTVKKMEKVAQKESGIDFIRLGFALFFLVVLSYSFINSGVFQIKMNYYFKSKSF